MDDAIQDLVCKKCGKTSEMGSVFCNKCGTTLQSLVSHTPSSALLNSGRAQPKPKRILLKWSLLATGLVLIYVMWQCGTGIRAGARLSDATVRHFHSQLDSEAFDDIVRNSDEAFQKSDSREEIVKFLAAVHSKLGLSHGSTRTNIFVNATTNGTFIKVTYQSTFDHGNAVEAFTWKYAGGDLKLVRYDVNSKAFLTQ